MDVSDGERELSGSMDARLNRCIPCLRRHPLQKMQRIPNGAKMKISIVGEREGELTRISEPIRPSRTPRSRRHCTENAVELHSRGTLSRNFCEECAKSSFVARTEDSGCG